MDWTQCTFTCGSDVHFMAHAPYLSDILVSRFFKILCVWLELRQIRAKRFSRSRRGAVLPGLNIRPPLFPEKHGSLYSPVRPKLRSATECSRSRPERHSPFLLCLTGIQGHDLELDFRDVAVTNPTNRKTHMVMNDDQWPMNVNDYGRERVLDVHCSTTSMTFLSSPTTKLICFPLES